jgi:anthranilate phosphoribosyltransferase
MTETHPFAQYVRILGRGRTLSRSLTFDEAEAAMGMILRDDVLPEQLGAFMMLLRVKEETADEIAGFVQAVRNTFVLPDDAPQVDLDWSSYAGKRRQLPWFLLAALTLVHSGVRVFMHGTEGHTPGRMYTRATLEALGFSMASTLDDAADQLRADNFAYLPLQSLSPKLYDLIQMRNIFGLRSPVHTVSRMLNPFQATCLLQGIFHPGYMETHQVAAQMLGETQMAVFRGEGGEIECRPNKPFEVRAIQDGVLSSEDWPPMLDEPRQAVDVDMDIDRMNALWSGGIEDEYAEAAIAGTLAVAMKTMGKDNTIESALNNAGELWRGRDKARFGL